MTSKKEYLKNIDKHNWIFSSKKDINLFDYVLDNDDNLWIIEGMDNLDYILDINEDIWIVNEIHNNKPLGFMIYKHDDNGERFNYFTGKNYIKNNKQELKDLPSKIKAVFKPRQFYMAHKDDLPLEWKNFAKALNNAGIKDEDIGIFGSYLLGFDITKDVDFVIYGLDALTKCYKNIDKIKRDLNATDITEKHIQYQYDKFKNYYNPKYDLKTIISRNWSGIQIADGVLSTIRSVILEKQCIPLLSGKKEVVVGEITNALESACLPRRAEVKVGDETFEIVSSLWKLQSFARIGDKLEIYGLVDRDKKIILINDFEDYIRFLN